MESKLRWDSQYRPGMPRHLTRPTMLFTLLLACPKLP